ncbi:MAG: transglycosylase domain-containing protein [Deltaproteobacteria bacterium]|nr:transglycosylase domain-containing protein [Deltaproteobacteria bacterium]
MKNKRFKILIYSILILLLFCVTFLTGIYIQVSRDTSGSIERGAIESIIFSESPVFYDDAKTPIGVYFEKTHSKYIKYKDIPKDYIKALIASEDGNFFNHPGFDIKAITRAFIANLMAGRVVQGGSTLTQQTAKNVFKRQKRTYMAKLRELFQAILLEWRYTKKEILEMYVNQFFVTGFGKGLRIAAEYFFDKEAEDLDLVESAFMAGLVKGPYLYNPFIKKTEKEREKARQLAKERKNYVLRNMRRLNLITEDDYLDAMYKEIPFKEGKVTYRLNVVLDYIREQLESEYFREILQEQGVDNIATSGIRIYTSIDREIQAGALESIRRHLPLLDVKLTGYDTEIFHERYMKHAGSLGIGPRRDIPFFARITQINSNPENPSLMVAWGNGGGIIGYAGIKEMGDAWLKWKLGEWAVFDRRHIQDFLMNFHKGDQVPIRYMESKEEDSRRRLILTEIPDLEGGVVVIKNGMIKAMVGGYFDRYFNRAADAKRQLGSIFKPLVFTAALQLKWNNLDTLINMRDIFRFENTYYLPNPDHTPKSNKVSMAWAGAKSENLATVWLLYHLTDRLNMSEFRHVVERLGLDRDRGEPYMGYVRRIRDRHGIIVNRDAIMEAAFEESKKEVESDLIFNGLEHALDNLRRLHFSIDRTRLDLKKETD